MESRWKVLGGVVAVLLVVVAGAAAQQQLGDGSLAVSLPLGNRSSPPGPSEFIVLPDSPEELDSPENILGDNESREVPLLIPLGPVVSLSANGGFEQFHGGIEVDDLLPDIDDLTLERDSLEVDFLPFAQPESFFPTSNGFSSGAEVVQPVGVPLIATGPQVPQSIADPTQQGSAVEIIGSGVPLSSSGPQVGNNRLGQPQNIVLAPDDYPVTDENADAVESSPDGTAALEAAPEIVNEIITNQPDDTESVTEALFIDISDGEEEVSQVFPTSPAAEVEQVMAELAAAAPEQNFVNDTIAPRAMNSAEPSFDPLQDDPGVATDEPEVISMTAEDMAVVPEVIAEDAFTGEVYREDVLPENPEISIADLEQFFVADDPQAVAAEEELGKDVIQVIQQLPEDQLDIAPLPDIKPYSPEEDSDVIDEAPITVIVPDFGDDVSINEVIEGTEGEPVPLEDEPLNEPPVVDIVTEVTFLDVPIEVVPEEDTVLIEIPIDEAPVVVVPVPETPVDIGPSDVAPEVNEVVDYDIPLVTSVDDLVAIMGDFGEKLPDDVDIRAPVLESAPAPAPEVDPVMMFDPAPVTDPPPPPPPPPPPTSADTDPVIFPNYPVDPSYDEYPEYVSTVEELDPVVEDTPQVISEAPASDTDVFNEEDIMMMMNFDAAPTGGNDPVSVPVTAPAPVEVPVLANTDAIVPDPIPDPIPVTEPVPVTSPEASPAQMPDPAIPPAPPVEPVPPVEAPVPVVETAPPVEAPAPVVEIAPPVGALVPAADPAPPAEMYGPPKPSNVYTPYKPTTKAPSYKPTAPNMPYRPATSHFHYKEPKPEHHKPNYGPSPMYGAPTPAYKPPPYKPPSYPRPTQKPPSYGYPPAKPPSYGRPHTPKSTTMSYGPPSTTPPSPYKSRPTYMSYKPSPPSYKPPQIYKAPAPGYKPPPPTYKAPSLSYKAPQPTYKAPPPTYKPPSPSYKPPQPTYKAPPPPSTSNPPPPPTYKPPPPPPTYKPPPPPPTYKPPPLSTTVKTEKPTTVVKPILAPLLIPGEPSGIVLPEKKGEGPYSIWNIPSPADRRQRLQVPDSVVHLLNAPQPEWVSSLEPER
ncbi:cell surface glycoprotein 1-like isoform X2 [Macrobrachium rosenbergii]|uniref:cell surface glycoprotein 1-like isoform X2 n=1 Tax=Macrobrachium rosenbergii TaxID=79674 RepID=UPI0034D7A569